MEAAITYARAHPAGTLMGSGSTLASVNGTLPAETLTGSVSTVADVIGTISAGTMGSGSTVASVGTTFFAGTLTGSGLTVVNTGGMLTASAFTGTMTIPLELFETAARNLQRIYWESPNIIAEFTNSQQIFDAIQALYLSSNTSRDRKVADRITALYRDALADDEHILPASLSQFADFFLANPEVGLPKITLTPDGTLRARWIHGPKEFVAVEFTGEPLAKFVAEIPRDHGLTAPHFASEPLKNIVSVIRAIGASLA